MPEGADTKASENLGQHLVAGRLTEAELRDCMGLYLADDGKFLSDNGHALRLLPGRLNAYRQRIAESEPPPLSPEAHAELMRIEEEEEHKRKASGQ